MPCKSRIYSPNTGSMLYHNHKSTPARRQSNYIPIIELCKQFSALMHFISPNNFYITKELLYHQSNFYITNQTFISPIKLLYHQSIFKIFGLKSAYRSKVVSNMKKKSRIFDFSRVPPLVFSIFRIL